MPNEESLKQAGLFSSPVYAGSHALSFLDFLVLVDNEGHYYSIEAIP
jgi:hypothetical protein